MPMRMKVHDLVYLFGCLLLSLQEVEPQLQLTPHALLCINFGDDVPSPVLQLLSFEKLTDDENNNARYKVVLSDATHMQLVILPPKYSDLLLSETLKIGCILSLIAYSCRNIWNSRYDPLYVLLVCSWLFKSPFPHYPDYSTSYFVHFTGLQ